MRDVEQKLDAVAAQLTHEINQLYAERDALDMRIDFLAQRRAVLEAAVPLVGLGEETIKIHCGGA